MFLGRKMFLLIYTYLHVRKYNIKQIYLYICPIWFCGLWSVLFEQSKSPYTIMSMPLIVHLFNSKVSGAQTYLQKYIQQWY